MANVFNTYFINMHYKKEFLFTITYSNVDRVYNFSFINIEVPKSNTNFKLCHNLKHTKLLTKILRSSTDKEICLVFVNPLV